MIVQAEHDLVPVVEHLTVHLKARQVRGLEQGLHGGVIALHIEIGQLRARGEDHGGTAGAKQRLRDLEQYVLDILFLCGDQHKAVILREHATVRDITEARDVLIEGAFPIRLPIDCGEVRAGNAERVQIRQQIPAAHR